MEKTGKGGEREYWRTPLSAAHNKRSSHECLIKESEGEENPPPPPPPPPHSPNEQQFEVGEGGKSRPSSNVCSAVGRKKSHLLIHPWHKTVPLSSFFLPAAKPAGHRTESVVLLVVVVGGEGGHF